MGSVGGGDDIGAIQAALKAILSTLIFVSLTVYENMQASREEFDGQYDNLEDKLVATLQRFTQVLSGYSKRGLSAGMLL